VSAHRSITLVLSICTLLAAACRSERTETPAVQVRPRGIDTQPALPSPPPAAPQPEQPSAIPAEPYRPSEPSAEPAQEPAEEPAGEVVSAEEAAPDEEKPPRNFSRELESMVGSPATCLAPRPANEAPAQVRIALSASVMPSGAVGRGEVSAAGLSPSELECVKQRVENLRFAPPIENAPFTVSGTITLNRGG
jgi:hypothetical protein